MLLLSVFFAIWAGLIGLCSQQVAAIPLLPGTNTHSRRQYPIGSIPAPIVAIGGFPSPNNGPGSGVQVLGSPITFTIVRTLTIPIFNTILNIPTITIVTTTSTVTSTVPTSTTTATFLFTPTPSISTITASTVVIQTVQTVITSGPSPASILQTTTPTPTPTPTPTLSVGPSTEADTSENSQISNQRNGSSSIGIMKHSSWRSGSIWVYCVVVIGGAMLIL